MFGFPCQSNLFRQSRDWRRTRLKVQKTYVLKSFGKIKTSNMTFSEFSDVMNNFYIIMSK